jgi:hypothetical protein
MAEVIRLTIEVDDLESVLQKFDRIKVYRSVTGYSGVFTELTTVATQIPLVQGVTTYEFLDNAGAFTYFYATSYYHSATHEESGRSDPQLGDDPLSDNILSVADLKAVYLFGVDLTNDRGEAYPPIMFKWGIRAAIASLERELDIKIKPTRFVERYDYYRCDYLTWTIIRLRQSPVISVASVKVMWPSNTEVINFPTDWIQLRADMGQINIVPTSGTLSQVLMTAGGSFLPLVASGREFVPNILEVDYTCGFALGECPMDLREVIGKLSAFSPLNIAGDLIAGAGIASQSVSMDGLSQSINTTSSPTNAGYGARLIQYEKELKRVLPMLRRYYKGLRLGVL